jgi:hypothetical protein
MLGAKSRFVIQPRNVIELLSLLFAIESFILDLGRVPSLLLVPL